MIEVVLLGGAGGVLLGGWYLSFTATRLDRLHARVESSAAALDAQLVRRASTALELAISGLLDPASALLVAEAATEARDSDGEHRELAESDLTKALHAALESPTAAQLRVDPVGATLLGELSSASSRVALARRFHNEAVRGARAVRGKPLVRVLRLAGHAPMPPTFEMDDSLPAALVV